MTNDEVDEILAALPGTYGEETVVLAQKAAARWRRTERAQPKGLSAEERGEIELNEKEGRSAA